MTLNPRTRIPDHLDTILPSGRTVREAASGRPDFGRTAEEWAALNEALERSDRRLLNRLARLFTAGHGR